MNILFFSTVLPSSAAPTRGTFNSVLLNSLGELGHDVRAAVPVPWHESLRSGLAETPRNTEIRFWYPPGVAPGLLHRFLWWSVKRRVGRFTADWTPDVVVGYWTHPDGTVAEMIGRQLGVPVVLVTGGTDVNLLAGEPSRRRLITATLLAADRVVAIGSGLASRVAVLGVPGDRISIFRRGVDTERFHHGDSGTARRRLELADSGPILLWVGRMVPVKGLDVLLKSMIGLGGERPPVLYLVGGGPLEAQLRDLTSKLGIGKQVRFVGPVPHQQLGDWYRAADLVVLPSLSEGTPNVLLEALACGRPFVASRVGSIPDLAESPDWLVPPGDPAALSERVAAMLAEMPAVDVPVVDDRGAARQFAGVLTETVAAHRARPDNRSRHGT